MAGETRRLAEFISATAFGKLPAEVVHQAKRVILDHLGIARFGATSASAKTVVETVKRLGGTQESTIIGDPGRFPSHLAPLANGTMAYSQMTDDLYPGRVHAHPGNNVIPAALALGESRGISGAEFIAAVVAGYEVICRAADAAGWSSAEMGFYPSSVFAHFGAAAAGARALGLDCEQCCSALGLAGEMASGIREEGVVESPSQPVLAGKASSNGVLATLLASAGLKAGDTIFEGREGKRGFLHIFSQSPEPEQLVEGLGSTYRISGVGFKFHAAAGGIQPSIDAMVSLVEKHGFGPKDVEKITVKGNRLELANHNNPDPKTQQAAVQSSRYCVARALTDGMVLARHTELEMLQEPQVREVMGKIGIELDPDHDRAMMNPPYLVSATLVVQTKDGKVYQETVSSAKGMMDNPATDQDLEKKFNGLVAPVIPESRAAAIRTMVWDLDKLADIRQLATLLRP